MTSTNDPPNLGKLDMPKRLREKLKNNDCLIGPGVFDGISAHVANTVGFDWLYLAGSGTSGSYCGEVRDVDTHRRALS